MKICKLKLKNLNSFRDPVAIDFENPPLDDASLVAITGPTGAGKTTLLDAICVALYGKTPRLSGTTNQHPRHLISHGETEGFAEIHFEANNTRYHATWSIRRNRSPQSQLFNDSDELITTNVAQEVESILGLDFGAFKRSVMLAQGEFAAFLKASKEERRAILEATIDSYDYDLLKQTLNDKVSQLEAVHEEVNERGNRIRVSSHEIDAARERLVSLQRQSEVLDANRQRIRARLELANAEVELRSAAADRTAAKEQVETNQTVFDEVQASYAAASTERDRRMRNYAEARPNIGRAEDRFAEVDKRTSDLTNLTEQINTLENQLSDGRTEQEQLNEQIENAQRFLNENSLPSDRQQRLNRATGFLAQLDALQNQLEDRSVSRDDCVERVSSLENRLETLFRNREERLAEQAEAVTALGNAEAELDNLQTDGTREDWNTRRQQALQAQPIAQRYETANSNLANSEDRLHELNVANTELDTILAQIENELTSQAEVCQREEDAVQRCEDARESALLANPINQLRQRLQPGEPCSVCGATDHPCVDVVEPEAENLLQDAETALTNARDVAQSAQNRIRDLQTRQARTEQNSRNTAEQIMECATEIETLQDETTQLLTEWREIYPDADVSSAWTAEQVDDADTAIAALETARQVHTQATHNCETATQRLETCDNDIARDTESLNETEMQLSELSDAVEDLQAGIASTESRFWELLPDAFHGVAPQEAVDEFNNMIEAIGIREDERRNAEARLQVLNTEITADEGNLENLRERREVLQTEIDAYRAEGEAFLEAAREITGGLETEDEINVAIEALEADMQTKEVERDNADRQLQESQNLLTETQIAHEICEVRCGECAERFETACQAYFNRLENAEFNWSEAHDAALSEVLVDIETQAEEIEVQFQEAQQKVGEQRQIVNNLQNALQERENLEAEAQEAKQEWKRWRRLQKTIPANDLRDFALEIMFRQMVSLANEQLKYLTSERYQLEVETIGDLSVVDRWNANEKRPVETLSGGESFLTSLALALALSELSRGRAQLNSLFLDEGFGTLDTETLDIAIAALEGLRMQGRNIFLISHIQELTRRLPVKIQVNKKGNGSSSVKIQG
ncbi:MAG: AAA family ATPase [Candidatus Poribacteria bacterium]|nr:AAA family ATPase [Candidatus Poribacteria bacterium]